MRYLCFVEWFGKMIIGVYLRCRWKRKNIKLWTARWTGQAAWMCTWRTIVLLSLRTSKLLFAVFKICNDYEYNAVCSSFFFSYASFLLVPAINLCSPIFCHGSAVCYRCLVARLFCISRSGSRSLHRKFILNDRRNPRNRIIVTKWRWYAG